MLGLGDGEAVAGDDDDLAGVGEQHADVLGGRRSGPAVRRARSAADAVTTEPNALNRMFGSERPIAWLIIRVSRVPDAPTSVPATMSRSEPIVKPDAATASPVNELSSEMRTGTSAPPIGSTKATPEHERRARARTPEPRERPGDEQDDRRRPTTATPSTAFDQLLAG